MKITKVKIDYSNDENAYTKAIVSVTIDNKITFNEIKINPEISNKIIYKPTMPTIKGKMDLYSNRELFYFFNNEIETNFNTIIMDAYNNNVSEQLYPIQCSNPKIEVNNFRLIFIEKLWVSVDIIYDECIVIPQVLVIKDKNNQFQFDFGDTKYIEFQDDEEFERICNEIKIAYIKAIETENNKYQLIYENQILPTKFLEESLNIINQKDDVILRIKELLKNSDAEITNNNIEGIEDIRIYFRNDEYINYEFKNNEFIRLVAQFENNIRNIYMGERVSYHVYVSSLKDDAPVCVEITLNSLLNENLCKQNNSSDEEVKYFKEGVYILEWLLKNSENMMQNIGNYHYKCSHFISLPSIDTDSKMMLKLKKYYFGKVDFFEGNAILDGSLNVSLKNGLKIKEYEKFRYMTDDRRRQNV
jgi:DNA-binding cell septation regulator SpoVG